MNEKNRVLLKAAVAGIVGAAALAAPGTAADKKPAKAKKKMAEVVECYGVNKCKGTSKCAMAEHACMGMNSCKGQGWLPMPKESCEAIEGGSVTPPKAEKAEKKGT